MISCDKDKNGEKPDPGVLQLIRVRSAGTVLSFQAQTESVEVDQSLSVEFVAAVDTASSKSSIKLFEGGTQEIQLGFSFIDDYKTIMVNPVSDLKHYTLYTLSIGAGLKGASGESFPGINLNFRTKQGKLVLTSISLNSVGFLPPVKPINVSFDNVLIEANFSAPLDPSDYQGFFNLSGTGNPAYSLSEDKKKVSIQTTSPLKDFTRHFLSISSNLTSDEGFPFDGFTGTFYTSLDSTPKFPKISDDELLTLVQQQTFKYFWDFGHPVSGMARERNTSGDVVTTGGSGFGIMAMIVAVERGFISRSQALVRLDKILDFLEKADRFHGAWPHWLNGNTGKTIPFSPNDDGGDLVETSFLIQGLLAFRQYLDQNNAEEKTLADRITVLWEGIEFDFYSRGQNALYWHWSPTTGWAINFKLVGYNETFVCYVLGVASPTHSISPASYYTTYMANGGILNGQNYYGYKLPMGESYGGPLFFTHYSFLGVDPRNLKDNYINYWEQHVNHSLINWSYCKANPKNYPGYGEHGWGLTASDNYEGYSAHSPTNDKGVITPTASLSSFPYTPEQSMKALHHFYYDLGNRLWGIYGFYDAYSPANMWYASSYIAIDQGPIIVMIENYRSGLIWDLFMSDPAITAALTKMGFTY